MSKKMALKIIAEKLKGLRWMIDSGMAVEVYTNGRRVANDIDIVVFKEDFEEVVSRLGAKAVVKAVEKGRMKIMWEKYASVVIAGVPAELICQGKLIIDGKEHKVDVTKEHFVHAKDTKYLGAELNIAPREEILVHKSILGRDKDQADIALLLDGYNPDRKLLELYLNMYHANEKERKVVLSKLLT